MPVPETLRAVLAERVAAGEPDDPLLVEEPAWVKNRRRTSVRIQVTTLRDRIARACERAGVPVFTPHGLRRLADDMLYEAGVDPGITSKTLGQSPEVALRSYRQVRPTTQHRAMLRAGRDTVLREPGVKVIYLPGATAAPEIDLSPVPTDLLLAELHSRGWTPTQWVESAVAEGGRT